MLNIPVRTYISLTCLACLPRNYHTFSVITCPLGPTMTATHLRLESAQLGLEAIAWPYLSHENKRRWLMKPRKGKEGYGAVGGDKKDSRGRAMEKGCGIKSLVRARKSTGNYAFASFWRVAFACHHR